jgi:hypothetical protein
MYYKQNAKEHRISPTKGAKGIIGFCTKCKNRPGNVNCIQQLCKRCCLQRPNNGCRLNAHRIAVSDSDSSSESEEEDEKCKACKTRSANILM